MRGDRSSGTATVLFTDLVGSTELMSRLGDVAFDQLRGEHFARLRDAVSAAGGEEIKNTGDGILAPFTSAVDALAAAVAAQQATERHAHSVDFPRFECARMLLRRAGSGDAPRAHDMLRRALSDARGLGLGEIERRAAALLT